jgi:hypothetical protein
VSNGNKAVREESHENDSFSLPEWREVTIPALLFS